MQTQALKSEPRDPATADCPAETTPTQDGFGQTPRNTQTGFQVETRP